MGYDIRVPCPKELVFGKDGTFTVEGINRLFRLNKFENGGKYGEATDKGCEVLYLALLISKHGSGCASSKCRCGECHVGLFREVLLVS